MADRVAYPSARIISTRFPIRAATGRAAPPLWLQQTLFVEGAALTGHEYVARGPSQAAPSGPSNCGRQNRVVTNLQRPSAEMGAVSCASGCDPT